MYVGTISPNTSLDLKSNDPRTATAGNNFATWSQPPGNVEPTSGQRRVNLWATWSQPPGNVEPTSAGNVEPTSGQPGANLRATWSQPPGNLEPTSGQPGANLSGQRGANLWVKSQFPGNHEAIKMPPIYKKQIE